MSEELAGLIQEQTTGPTGAAGRAYRMGVFDGALAAFKMAAETLDRYRPEADPDEAVEVAAEGLWRHVTVRDVSTWADAPDASKVSMRRQAASVLAALSERYDLTPKRTDRD